MGQINLLIADFDLEYIEFVKNYIRHSDYKDKFNLKSFSQRDKFITFLESSETKDILLVSEDFVIDIPLDNYKVIILSERVANAEDGNGGNTNNHLRLYRYQPLNQLITKITALYLEEGYNTHGSRETHKSTKVITIYSANGGAGKTTLALNLTKHLTSLDKQVFYLNLEALNASNIFFPTTGSYDLSKIIYYLKADTKQIKAKIAAIKKYDPYTRAEFFEPLVNPYEALDITRNDIKSLIDSLIQLDCYDFIIIDTESSLHERIVEASNLSDYLLWLVQDDLQSSHKTTILLKQFELSLEANYQAFYNKLSFILNRYLGEQLKNSHNTELIKISGYLPYIPAWKTVSEKEQLLNEGAYIADLAKIIKQLGII